MATRIERQNSFAAGELSPSMWGDTENPRYARGLRLMRDFFVSKHGMAISRPGTRFMGLATSAMMSLTPTFPANILSGQRPRLIPFFFSDSDGKQNAVLEFGEQSIRVRQADVIVADNLAANGGVGGIGGIAVPYHQADLHKIRYAQSLDVLFIACDGYAPATLTRNSNANWDYEQADFTRPQPSLIASDSPVGGRVDESTFGAVDGTHPLVKRTWLVTQTGKDSRGVILESAPVVCEGMFWYGFNWNPLVTFQLGTVVKGTANIGDAPYYVSLQNGNLNNIYTVSGDTAFWKHVPTWTNFAVYNVGDWAWSATFGAAKSKTNGNLNHALNDATNWEPIGTQWQNDIFASDVSTPLSLDRPVTINLPTPALGANFIEFDIYAGQNGAYGWIGSSVGPFFVDTGITPDLSRAPPEGTNPFQVFNDDGTLNHTETPIAVSFFEDRLTWAGTAERPSTVFPSAVGDYSNFDQLLVPTDASSMLFALSSRKRERIRSILGKDKLFTLTDGALWAIEGAQGPLTPTSIEAHVHVDVGADWAAPLIVGNSILWVRDQGSGLRAVEFDFSRGAYTGTDLSFFADHLVIGHRILDMCHAENPWGVTWCVREDGILLSLTYSPDNGVWGWARHEICLQADGTPQKVLSVCSIPENGQDFVYMAVADPAGGPAWILRFSSRLELDDEALATAIAGGGGLEYSLGTGLGATTTGTAAANIVQAGMPICLDAWINAQNHPSDSGGVFHFTGLTLQENRSVFVIIDGVIYGPLTVAGDGTLAVDTGTHALQPGANIYLGFSFLPSLELLDVSQGRTRQKVVNDLGIEVKAYGDFYAGADGAHLNKFKGPNLADDDMVRARILGNYGRGGRAYIRQALPLPLTVRAVTREVEVGSG